MPATRPPAWLRPVTALLILALASAFVLAQAGEPANDFHCSLIGDRTGGNHPGVYERVWREVDLLSPDFAVNVGDTIEGYVKGDDLVPVTNAQWDQISQIKAPYRHIKEYYTPGNHDIWDAGSETIYKERAAKETHYAFRYQQALFVILDNSRQNELDEAQYAFLEQSLQQNADANPKFVVFHKPFWLGYVQQNDTTHRLHRLCKQHGVSYVISGHGHQLFHYRFDGLGYLEVGSSGGSIGKNEAGQPNVVFENGRFFHHVWMRVKGSNVRLMVKELDGAAGAGRVFELTRWRGSNPTFTPSADPYTAERAAARPVIAQPAAGNLARGVVPLIGLIKSEQAGELVLKVDGQPVTPQAGGLVALLFEGWEQNRQFINLFSLNGAQVARLAEGRDVKQWEWYAYAVPAAQFRAQDPPQVQFTAGTATDGSGANPPENNDDYQVRGLTAYDGENYLVDPSRAWDTIVAVGDNAPGATTAVSATLARPTAALPLRVVLHAWDTTGLAAGEHNLELVCGDQTASTTVVLP
ncbi:MAG: metallophosphoesterase [Fimbriimonadaceae bacterium]|nr:metallophosphoesterase [Fimbriimonadaceae bacterium]